MTKDFLEEKKREQASILKEYRTSLFDNATDIGYSKKNNEWFDYFIKPQESNKNLYKGIREEAIAYFEKYGIAWWQCLNEPNEPTGHMVSSQINCLNHLFAIRTDEKAVRLIIEKVTGIQFDEILPSLIDNDEHSFISFEFTLDNDKLLGENDEGWGRGILCTSIDVMIIARKGEKKWLIPIEWKYTESYKKEDKTNQTRMDRYAHLIEVSTQLRVPEDGIAHSNYFSEPNYELMRQTLLCEQLVKNGYADYFFHINIIPTEHTELRSVVEKEFVPMLKDSSKFRIIDPHDLLAPIEQEVINNSYEEYKDLINYLQTRYWKK